MTKNTCEAFGSVTSQCLFNVPDVTLFICYFMDYWMFFARYCFKYGF